MKYTEDEIVDRVIQKLIDRSKAGMETYGVPMTRLDTNIGDWVLHAQEEALDLANYLEAILYRLKGDVYKRT